MSLGTCDTANCAGHLGKFPDCLTEALWAASMNGMDETTGSTEWSVHVTMVAFYKPEVLSVDGQAEWSDAQVTVEPGVYLVFTNDQGRVWHEAYPIDSSAGRDRFTALDADYGAWVGDDE